MTNRADHVSLAGLLANANRRAGHYNHRLYEQYGLWDGSRAHVHRVLAVLHSYAAELHAAVKVADNVVPTTRRAEHAKVAFIDACDAMIAGIEVMTVALRSRSSSGLGAALTRARAHFRVAEAKFAEARTATRV